MKEKKLPVSGADIKGHVCNQTTVFWLKLLFMHLLFFKRLLKSHDAAGPFKI